MILNKNTNILIVGLGVIGGGYASALTKAGYNVSCITKNQADIDYALSHGMIKQGSARIDAELIAKSEFIIFALYPTTFVEWIEKYQHLFTPGTIITDVCGVKSSIVYKVQDILREDIEFIAHHPMAGREKSGVEYSSPEVFRGANFIITPTEKNTDVAKQMLYMLAEIIGFTRVSELSPEEHDSMIAFLSQLTHAIAVSLMNANTDEGLEKYTGDSFRDLTRIAKINENMWSELFLLNKDALLQEMDAFQSTFSKLRGYIEDDNREAIMGLMRYGTARRELFDKPKI